MLGVTGGPGAGKSTFADSLCEELNALTGTSTALVVPMDGFHKTNAELHALGMWEQKGEPETFDSADFLNLLSRIHNYPDKVSTAPRFDRKTDEPVPDSLHIHPSHTFIIVEGNYLLLATAPWSDIPGILDEVWYIEAPQEVVIERLRERHLLRGLEGDDLDRKIALSDLKNAQRIAQCKHFAGRILSLPARQQ
jgi:pantothenate kinase